MPAALSGVAKEGLGALAGKIPGFAALGGAESAAPAGPAASSSAAAGPTMATKTKFMQMIQTEIATLNGSIDEQQKSLVTQHAVALGARRLQVRGDAVQRGRHVDAVQDCLVVLHEREHAALAHGLGRVGWFVCGCCALCFIVGPLARASLIG